MNQFTQLNLNGKPEPKPESQVSKSQPTRPIPGKPGNHKNTHKPKTITIVGSAIAASLMGIAMLQSVGCSKAAKTTISAPTSQASNQPMTPAPTPVTTPEPVAKKPAKKTVKAKIPTATYSNKDFGVSFRYPKYDSLKLGDDAKVEWNGLGPVPMNFSQAGGTTLSAVELPNGLYPGTDFASAFFNTSVAPKLTEEQCNQFASSDAMPSKDAAPANPSSDVNASANSNSDSKDTTASVASTDKPASHPKVKIGNTEFSVMETIVGEDKQADAKYYHVYKNGNCYEFTLGMQTASVGDDETVTPVNRSGVFHKLEWILATVKIASPETQEAAPAAASGNASTGTVASAAPVAPVKVIDDRQ
ncbi:MAG TPA: hypothetical protein VGF44_09655 [Terriglobales bacterium]|jgi:hypothetical protein